MTPFLRLLLSSGIALASLVALPAGAEMIGGNPGPAHNYVCPNADKGPPLDCYFDAVRHLYTMCRHVKSIEIIEFGYEKSTEGSNGAKSEYCVDKQKLNMHRPYTAALKEAALSRQAVEMVQSLQEYWLDALARLSWAPGESDDQYKARTLKVYEVFDERIAGIKTVVATVRERAPSAAAAKPARGATAKASH